jgi:hypothetical protein
MKNTLSVAFAPHRFSDVTVRDSLDAVNFVSYSNSWV